jgi:RES domain-containing protein
MILWRISRHSTLDGHGGLLASARWHTRGQPIVYLAESPAGALLEVLVHLELTVDSLPSHYGLLKAEAPDETSLRTLGPLDLSEDWVSDVILTRSIGDEWLASGSEVLLRVPSAIVPETFNVLLNPTHPDAGRVQALWHQEYP